MPASRTAVSKNDLKAKNGATARHGLAESPRWAKPKAGLTDAMASFLLLVDKLT